MNKIYHTCGRILTGSQHYLLHAPKTKINENNWKKTVKNFERIISMDNVYVKAHFKLWSKTIYNKIITNAKFRQAKITEFCH